jgi:MFS family permease
MARRLRLLTMVVGFSTAPVAMFWFVSYGSDGDLGWVLVFLVAMVLGLVAVAAHPQPIVRRVTLVLGLAIVQVALLFAAVACGRAFFRWRVVSSLNAYQAVADFQLSRLSREAKSYVRQDRPHEDLAWAEATRFEDGSSLVRLAFKRSPRTIALLLPSGHALPRVDEHGLCLESLSGNWQWYVRC